MAPSQFFLLHYQVGISILKVKRTLSEAKIEEAASSLSLLSSLWSSYSSFLRLKAVIFVFLKRSWSLPFSNLLLPPTSKLCPPPQTQSYFPTRTWAFHLLLLKFRVSYGRWHGGELFTNGKILITNPTLYLSPQIWVCVSPNLNLMKAFHSLSSYLETVW